ncbi:AAA domain-containing protein [Dyadobacter fermentans]|uniref:Type III restriction protein res subunit n=1 Tax=Dyadobacter fermentans (strain ATCC 700827 / DSM 18053 / CIP 107007 / KCTC 52180 / NS114) TaxID=471854 RepID=C6W6F5_DYAFD|nr:AAA domain-containing protein [Dyadobacter fermentans]ACT94295.1 type III restriction protein res subunit [Dyadobacter fermentans DSM 18053]
MDYFKRLLELLKIEREEDKQSYQRLIERSSVSERRANGLAWYPIAIRGQEMSRGDYLTVEVERTTHQEVPHQLRFGMPAVLFSNHEPKKDRVEGVVSHQGGNRLKITLRTDELPEWSRDGKLGIDLLFDDNSYDEMQSALKTADSLGSSDKEGHLIKVLTGEKAPSFDKDIYPITLPKLNPSQQRAVQNILSAQELAIVHGPPGTGKTTTLVQAIKALVKKDNRPILVVAPSNTAVDLLSEKLSEEGLNVLRVGNPVRVSERLTALTLDSKMSSHASVKDIKTLKKQANEYKNMAHKYKRHFGKAERDQRKALFDEAHRIMKDVANMEQYIIDDLLTKTQVVTATLVGSNHFTVRNMKYRTVVIDEAGQALEPACWIPILKAEKVVFAGDHLQLPPTIKSEEAAKGGLSTTLLEKCVALHPESVVLLEEQYRMNEAIMGYSSKVFYHDKLKAHESVAGRVLFPGEAPLAFVDTAGCGFDDKLEGTSSTNPEEAAFLFKHLTQLAAEFAKVNPKPESFPSIAIISPYKEQINILKNLLAHAPHLQLYLDKIAVNTIDSFQGQERDVVYISMTRNNIEGQIGFLADIRRMNVAMTRARKKLVVIGDSATLSVLPFYENFIAYAQGLNAYQSAWEFSDL